MDSRAVTELYEEAIPEDIQKGIKKFEQLCQNDNVVSVTLLSNFGKDMEFSLQVGVDIYKGVIVQLKSTYALSSEDRFWLHPSLGKGRSMYKGGKATPESSKLAKYNSCVGSYSSLVVDTIGGYSKTSNLIVDTVLEERADVLAQSWMLSRSNIKQAYTELVASKLVRDAQAMRDQIAKENEAGERLVTSNYNLLYSDGTDYYFYNHVIKPSKGKALVHISPLMGCSLVETAENVPADLLSSEKFISYSELTEEQRARAFTACKWQGSNVVNTFTMRQPIEKYKEALAPYKTNMYTMTSGYFSANPVHSKLPIDIVLFLTPEKHLLPTAGSFSKHVHDGIVQVPASPETLAKLMQVDWKNTISKRLQKGDSLMLKRELVKLLL